MQNFNHIQNSFFFGEVDPKTKGLVGTDFLKSALSECKGFIPLPTGGISRCAGTFYSHSDSYEQTGGKCRLEVVKVEGQQEIYELGKKVFGNEYYILKIYAGKISAFSMQEDTTINQIKALLFNTSSTPSKVVTVTNNYQEHEIDELSIAVNKGKVYIAHQNHQLEMYDLYESTREQIKITRSILMSTGVDFNSIRNYPSVVTFKSGRMVLSATLNKPNTVWLSRTPEVSDINEEVGTVDMVDRYTDFTLFDITKTVTRTRKYDDIENEIGTKIERIDKTISYSTGASDEYSLKIIVTIKDKVIDGTKTTETTTKITKTSTGTNEGDAEVDLIMEEITQIVDDNGEKSTTFTYNEKDSYTVPTVTFTDDDTETDVKKNIDNSHAIEVQESDLAGTRVKWVSPAGKMTFATSNALFISDGQIPTPSTFDLTIGAYITTGSKKYKTIRNYVLFAGKDDKSLYLAYYNYETEGLAVTEVTANAKHMVNSGIRDFTIMFDPYPIIWVINGNGELCSATLNFLEGRVIVGWAVQNTKSNREYISLAIAGESYDTLVLYVKTDETIFDFETLRIKDEYELETFIFNDRTKIVSFINWQPSWTSISVDNFNSGDEVDLILNNKYIQKCTVSNGSITFPSQTELTGSVVARIGLTRSSYVSFFDPILSQNGNALLVGHSIQTAYLKLYKSGECTLSDDKSKVEVLFKKLGITPTNEDVLLLSKDIKVNYPTTNSYDNARTLKLEVDNPFPFNLLAISYKYRITEN